MWHRQKYLALYHSWIQKLFVEQNLAMQQHKPLKKLKKPTYYSSGITFVRVQKGNSWFLFCSSKYYSIINIHPFAGGTVIGSFILNTFSCWKFLIAGALSFILPGDRPIAFQSIFNVT